MPKITLSGVQRWLIEHEGFGKSRAQNTAKRLWHVIEMELLVAALVHADPTAVTAIRRCI